jgi:hypothetical protein
MKTVYKLVQNKRFFNAGRLNLQTVTIIAANNSYFSCSVHKRNSCASGCSPGAWGLGSLSFSLSGGIKVQQTDGVVGGVRAAPAMCWFFAASATPLNKNPYARIPPAPGLRCMRFTLYQCGLERWFRCIWRIQCNFPCTFTHFYPDEIFYNAHNAECSISVLIKSYQSGWETLTIDYFYRALYALMASRIMKKWFKCDTWLKHDTH